VSALSHSLPSPQIRILADGDETQALVCLHSVPAMENDRWLFFIIWRQWEQVSPCWASSALTLSRGRAPFLYLIGRGHVTRAALTAGFLNDIYPVGTTDHVIVVPIFFKCILALSTHFRVVELNIQDKHAHRTPSSCVWANSIPRKKTLSNWPRNHINNNNWSVLFGFRQWYRWSNNVDCHLRQSR
jgi:hypothetical protein